ncbi:response regulator transcription factor [Adlercreutzia agrestimuris]|uniref:response regulator transcription factor n=1 Tax=Adlercreutzia agrestimuris TaxID=2941324 RepID=UPI00203E3796|nr:response regulator transcription factor [Adlercreutzia agrestimuris]
MIPRICIIEDDASLSRELAHIIELSDMNADVVTDNFTKAADHVIASQPDCVILDLKLPQTDGHKICRDIRAQSLVPIIMLTSSENEFDEVLSMNIGADDYVTKPYRPAVLLARIQAALRRSAQTRSDTILSYKDVELNTSQATVTYHGKTAELTRNEQRILQLLMRQPETVIPRSEIMCALWESDAFIDDNTLTVNVNRLRKTLTSLGVPDDFLITRRGLGYSV